MSAYLDLRDRPLDEGRRLIRATAGAVDASPELARIMRERFVFLTFDDAEAFRDRWPSLAVLVRCGGGRHLIELRHLPKINKTVERNRDYIRDVSIYRGQL